MPDILPAMFEISSLAHNISFAVFRVSRLILHKKLRSELEEAAISLVRDLSEGSALTLLRLIDLTEAVGEISEVNAGVLHREINNLLDRIIRENSLISEKKDSVYLGDILSSDSGSDGNYDAESNEYIHGTNGNNTNGASVKERQVGIVEFIRQFPNDCRMRDLSEKFSDVSERTLRNDIQALIEVGLVERLGGRSGPNGYFEVIDTSKYSGEESEGSVDGRILLPEANNKF